MIIDRSESEVKQMSVSAAGINAIQTIKDFIAAKEIAHKLAEEAEEAEVEEVEEADDEVLVLALHTALDTLTKRLGRLQVLLSEPLDEWRADTVLFNLDLPIF